MFREQLIWLAGFVDGEGTIGLFTQKNTGTIRVQFSLCNTKLVAMERAQDVISEILGRRIEFTTVKDKRGYRPCHVIMVRTIQEVKLVCEALLPYLVGKRENAEIMLDFIRLSPGKNWSVLRDSKGRLAGSPPNVEARQALLERMLFLNKRYSKKEWAALQQETELPAPVHQTQDEETIRTAWRHAETSGNISSIKSNVNLDVTN